ncbi:DNA-binding transcriptional regulator, MarR family [Roseomonas rosea]|jgi:MarR family transcriptional regulator, organic hydroperoxide resistance regulator|uniref:DNA-binding transcriptional regulator, MarR family n=1 Tax=Muricoccus roseus TaxID=198092 RepID=A0A1M6FKV7_9PROT|nr:MarR family winged helix-turn-helix transcriptional regulator [Roseomonas rosea]SHI98358.1 DNA-binding transcriptional regulator, MarR family [Roseomonas rosea]
MPVKQTASRGLPLTVSDKSLLVGGSDREFRTLVHDMLAFASSIQDVRNRLGQLIGLSGTQYTILMAIARLGEESSDLGINQLADHLHLSGAFVTIEVNKLVAAGLVTKLPNPDDRRRVMLAVTEAARQRVLELARVQSPANDALFAGLSATEFRSLLAVMGKLVRNGEPTLHLIEYLAPGGRLDGATPRRAPKAAAG